MVDLGQGVPVGMSRLYPELPALTEAAFEAINAGDIDALMPLIADDSEFTSLVAEADGDTFRGHEGARAWRKMIRSGFEEVRWDLLDVRGAGDRGVVRFRMAGANGQGGGCRAALATAALPSLP